MIFFSRWGGEFLKMEGRSLNRPILRREIWEFD